MPLETAPPHHDHAPTAALRRLDLLDGAPEEAFDRLTRLAARALSVPVALVNVIADGRQFFKSAVGMGEVRELPVETGVCACALASGEPLVIEDARADPRYSTNPIVTDFGLVAYLGVPLFTSGGEGLGTFCVVDTVPRAWAPADLETVRDLAATVTTELDLRLAARELERKSGELQDVVEGLAESEARYRFQAKLLDAVGQAVLATDPRGRITYWNRAAEALYGWSAAEVLGRDVLEVTPAELSREQAMELMERLAAGESWSGEFMVRRRDGASFPVMVHDTPVFDEAGELAAIIGASWDLTERSRTEEVLRSAKEEAERANRSKTEFLSAMSHELRTPLNAIAGYLELIEMGVHGPVTAAQGEAFGRIKRNQEHLLILINDVLHYARIEAGRTEFRTVSVRCEEILTDLEALFDPQAAARGIAYTVRKPGGGLSALCDPDRVQQVLLNLVGNAIKFTDPAGRVELSCEADERWVYVRVSDNGRGIAPERLPAVFDPFVQLERHRNETSQQGLGLGLAISRDLARGMGGDLTAESEPGRGSTFTLCLPRAGSTGREPRRGLPEES